MGNKSKTWFVTLDSHLSKDAESPIVTITGTETCVKKEGSHYHAVVDGGIEISFEVPIESITNEDDL